MYKRIYAATLLITLSLLLASLSQAENQINNVPNLPRYFIHYVEKGENLHDISGYYLSNPRRWREIYILNKDKIDNPDRLTVGLGLLIPVSALPPSAPSFKEYLNNIGLSQNSGRGVTGN